MVQDAKDKLLDHLAHGLALGVQLLEYWYQVGHLRHLVDKVLELLGRLGIVIEFLNLTKEDHLNQLLLRLWKVVQREPQLLKRVDDLTGQLDLQVVKFEFFDLESILTFVFDGLSQDKTFFFHIIIINEKGLEIYKELRFLKFWKTGWTGSRLLGHIEVQSLG